MAILRSGSRGSEVTKLQNALKAAGFDPGPIDGIYGPKTAAAVRKYQTSKGLTVDGIAGPQTMGSLYGSGDSGDSGDSDVSLDTGPEALPRGARLIRVGSEYRVIWDLPENGGTVWYSINTTQLTNIYDDDWESDVTEVYSNAGAYEAKYGDLHWGNVAEISRTAEDPWQDMMTRIIDEFGYVAGIEDPEIRGLIIQAHFEKWSTSTFLANYKNTTYYNSLGDAARGWAVLSDEEKARRIRTRASELANYYYQQYGIYPEGGVDNPDILVAAEEIESGSGVTFGEWKYNIKKAAVEVLDSPAHREAVAEEQSQGERATTISNWRLYAEEQWRKWVGSSVPIPDNYADEWANWLFMEDRSEADLENHLRAIATTYYPEKDPNLSYSEWSAIPRSYIQNTLELGTVDDDDQLLEQILSEGLTGYDMRVAIKNDPRYMQTKGAFNSISQRVDSIGAKMGFIPAGGDF